MQISDSALWTFVGFAGGWAVSHVYSRLSGRDLESKVRQLDAVSGKIQRSVNVLGHCLDAANLAECNYDDAGDLVEIQIHLQGHAWGSSVARGTLTILPPVEPPRYDRQHENPE